MTTRNTHVLDIILASIFGSSVFFSLSTFLADFAEELIATTLAGCLILITLCYLLFKFIKTINTKQIVFALLISIPFSCALILALNIISYGETRFTASNTWIKTLLCIPAFSLLIASALAWLQKPTVLRRTPPHNFVGKIYAWLFESQFCTAKIAICLLICWIPLFLLSYPGVWNFDTIYQSEYLLGNTTINAHHPILHTLWLTLPMELSQELFGTFTFGFAFYTITQMFAVAILLALIDRTIIKWAVPYIVPLGFFLAFCILPMFSWFSVCATKDVIFSALFGYVLTKIADLCIRSREVPSIRKETGLWIALCLLLLFRNNVIYAFLIFGIICLLVIREKSIFILWFSSLIVSFFLISSLLFFFTQAEEGGKNEMMSIPSVQLARTANVNDLDSKDMTFIEYYVPDWQQYNDRISDPTKGSFRLDSLKENPGSFLLDYLSLGLSYPQTFADAALLLNCGFWSPITNYDSRYFEYMTPWIYGNRYPTDLRPNDSYIYFDPPALTNSPLGKIQKYLAYAKIELHIPIISLLFQPGPFIWLTYFLCVACCYKKRKLLLLPGAFILTYWLTLLFGPVSMFRYAAPIFYAAPTLVALMFILKPSKPDKL